MLDSGVQLDSELKGSDGLIFFFMTGPSYYLAVLCRGRTGSSFANIISSAHAPLPVGKQYVLSKY